VETNHSYLWGNVQKIPQVWEARANKPSILKLGTGTHTGCEATCSSPKFVKLGAQIVSIFEATYPNSYKLWRYVHKKPTICEASYTVSYNLW
jgi:hypothetical protein